jgi:hypothetical protein
MTDAQTFNALALLASITLCFAFDVLAWRFRPSLAAPLAWVPVMTQRAALSVVARESLRAPPEGGTYRTDAPLTVDWSRLPGLLQFDAGDARVVIDPPRARALIRLPFNPRLAVVLTGGPPGVALFFVVCFGLFNTLGAMRTRAFAKPFAAVVIREIERRFPT